MSHSIVNPLYPRPFVRSGQSSVATGFMLTVSSSSSATSFTLANFGTEATQPANLVFLDIQGANVVCTFDGKTPLYGTSGHLLQVGTNYTWQGATLFAAKFALQTSSTATIYATEFAV